MRITIVNQFYLPDISPTAHLAASLAEHWAAQGHQVTVLASWGGYVDHSRQQARATEGAPDANPRVLRMWTPQLGKKSHLRRLVDYASFYLSVLARAAGGLPPQDVFVSLTTPPYIAWAAVLHKALHPRCRVVLWNMDCYPEAPENAGMIRRGGFISRALRALNRALFRQLDDVICLDTAMVDLLRTAYAPPPGSGRALHFDLIPNWERASLFPPPASHIDFRAAGRPFRVLYLGNMGVGHQFDTVLDAAERLRNEPVEFLFVGGGKRWQTVKDEAARRNLTNVVVRSYVPKEQTPALMADADCALITLRDLDRGVMCPSKVHANLAAGLPVVYVGPTGTNVDDAVQRFACGRSLRHGDVPALESFIRTLMTDPAEYATLRHRARQAFDQAYCDLQTLPQFDQVLDRLRFPRPLYSGGEG